MYMECTMRSSCSPGTNLGRLYGFLASQITHSQAHKVRGHFGFSCKSCGGDILDGEQRAESTDGSLCLTVEGASKCLNAMCSFIWASLKKAPSSGNVKFPPHSWRGRGPAGRCQDDLYTSPARPRPPASSAPRLP